MEAVLFFGKKIVIEGIGASIFLNKIYFSGTFNDIYKLGNYRMTKFRKDVDLPFKIPEFVWLI